MTYGSLNVRKDIPFRMQETGLSDEEFPAWHEDAYRDVMGQVIEQKKQWGWTLFPNERQYLEDHPDIVCHLVSGRVLSLMEYEAQGSGKRRWRNPQTAHQQRRPLLWVFPRQRSLDLCTALYALDNCLRTNCDMIKAFCAFVCLVSVLKTIRVS